MTNYLHKSIIGIYILILIGTTVLLGYYGRNYYNLPIESRYYTASGEVNQLNILLRPSGLIGHGLGIIGSTLIVVGLFGYMARKRVKAFARWGILKDWLELHIFVCTLGTILVLFHTSFKFGGIISVGFWCLMIVWVSGVIGRYLYLQIPRSIEGHELSLAEINALKTKLEDKISSEFNLSILEVQNIKLHNVRTLLRSKGISLKYVHQVKLLILKERRISRQLKGLDRMQRLFRYWHVAHLPFALVMIIIMTIHIAVSLFWGYKWIF